MGKTTTCNDCDQRLILCLLEQLKEKGYFGGSNQLPDLSDYYTSEEVDGLLLPFSEQITDFLTQVVLLNGTYANPNWLTSLAWSKIINRPTTLAGYGILDAVNLSVVNDAIAAAIAALVNNAPTPLNTLGELAAAIGNDANFNTTITNLIAGKVSLSGNYANPAWLASLAWSKLTGTPTTLAGYGITDALTNANLNLRLAFHTISQFRSFTSGDVTAKPTIYITDFSKEGLFKHDSTDSTSGAFFTGSISGTTLTVSAVANGALSKGQQVHNSTISANTFITNQLTGTAGGVGTYTVSVSQTVASAVMAADNLGTYIVSYITGDRFKRVFDKKINVRWFGAIGDNIADDTIALSNAITYCINNSYVCVFDAGEYKVTNNLYHNLSVNGNKNVYIEFVGDVKITVPSGNAIVDLPMINFSHNNNVNAHITGDNCTVNLNNKFKGFIRIGNYGFSSSTIYVVNGGFCKVDLNNLTILNTYAENVVNTSGDNAAAALFISGTFDRINIENVYVDGVSRSGGLVGDSYWGDCKGILVNNTRAVVIVKNCIVKNVLSHANYNANADGISVFGLKINGSIENCFRTGKALIDHCQLIDCQGRGIKVQTSVCTVSNSIFEHNLVVTIPNSRDIDFQYGNGKAFGNTIIFKKNGSTSPLDTYHASIRWCAILEDEEMYGIAENNTFYTDVTIPYPFFIEHRDGLSVAVERSTYDVINNHIINTDDFVSTGCIGRGFVEFDALHVEQLETHTTINIRDNSYFSSAQPLLSYNSSTGISLGDKLRFTLENNRNTNLAVLPSLFLYSSGGTYVPRVNRYKIFNNSGFNDRVPSVWHVDFNNEKIMPHTEFVVDLSLTTNLHNAPAGLPNTDYAFVKVLNEWEGVSYIQIYVHGSTSQCYFEWNGFSWKKHFIATDSVIGQHPLILTTTAATNVTFPNTGTLATLMGVETLGNKRVNPRVQVVGTTSTVTPNADAYDNVRISALSDNVTIASPTGTPVEGQIIKIIITDNGISRTMTWNPIYRGVRAALQTATVASVPFYAEATYNSTDNKWDVI